MGKYGFSRRSLWYPTQAKERAHHQIAGAGAIVRSKGFASENILRGYEAPPRASTCLTPRSTTHLSRRTDIRSRCTSSTSYLGLYPCATRPGKDRIDYH